VRDSIYMVVPKDVVLVARCVSILQTIRKTLETRDVCNHVSFFALMKERNTMVMMSVSIHAIGVCMVLEKSHIHELILL